MPLQKVTIKRDKAISYLLGQNFLTLCKKMSRFLEIKKSSKISSTLSRALNQNTFNTELNLDF